MQHMLDKAKATRNRLAKAMMSRCAQPNENSKWKEGAMRLATTMELMPLWAMPWDEIQLNDVQIDYDSLPMLPMPPTQTIIALPNVTGAPGMPGTEFLILCTPLDTSSIAFELIVDLGTACNDQSTQEGIASRARMPIQAIRELLSMPRCVGFHAGIITIDRAESDFYTVFNLSCIQCPAKRQETILANHRLYEPFGKCSTCADFQQIEKTNPLCCLHSVNIHTTAHTTIKVLQAKAAEHGSRPTVIHKT